MNLTAPSKSKTAATCTWRRADFDRQFLRAPRPSITATGSTFQKAPGEKQFLRNEPNPQIEHSSDTRPICHTGVAAQYRVSTHGKLTAAGSPDAPECSDCHSPHGTLGRTDTRSPTYSRNVPALCAGCHRTGQKAAVRYKGKQLNIVESYSESIHGKGLLESGLTVTANCADCHTAHRELPSRDPASSVNKANIAQTCAKCHRGSYEMFSKSIHSTDVTKTNKQLPDLQRVPLGAQHPAHRPHQLQAAHHG